MFGFGEILFILGGVLLIVWLISLHRKHSREKAFMSRIRKANPLIYFSFWQNRFQVMEIGGEATSWRQGALAITSKRVAIYPKEQSFQQRFRFKPQELRWFGRPVKYTYGTNEIWLHIEKNRRWYILKLKLEHTHMRKLVRTLKQIATPEQVTAYRRRRPYIHHGPVTAYPADEDQRGAWILDTPVTLYLMPLYLIVMHKGRVLRAFALDKIQQISALKRLDMTAGDGLVHFQMEGEKYAFAMQGHNRFADDLAEAAKRTLEDPMVYRRKAKRQDTLADDDDSDEDFIDEIDDYMDVVDESPEQHLTQ